MPPQETLRRILEDAIWAPSGDNVQPWKFERTADSLDVMNDIQADESLYNHRQSGSLMAVGALLRNIELAALAQGLKADISLFPRGPSLERIAQVRFHRTSEAPPEHYKVIRARCTNRTPYDARSLTENERTLFTEAPGGAVEARLVEGEKKDAVARASGMNERVVLENRMMHEFLFSHITWSAAQDAARPAFFVDTLGLKGPQRPVFRLYKYWSIARALNWLGIADLVVRDNTAMYMRSSAAIALLASDIDAATCVHAGIMMQELWLKATLAGLSAQPLAGIPLLAQALRAGGAADLSSAHRSMVLEANEQLERVFDAKGKHLLFVMRVGHAQPPSARTRRRALTIG